MRDLRLCRLRSGARQWLMAVAGSRLILRVCDSVSPLLSLDSPIEFSGSGKNVSPRATPRRFVRRALPFSHRLPFADRVLSETCCPVQHRGASFGEPSHFHIGFLSQTAFYRRRVAPCNTAALRSTSHVRTRVGGVSAQPIIKPRFTVG